MAPNGGGELGQRPGDATTPPPFLGAPAFVCEWVYGQRVTELAYSRAYTPLPKAQEENFLFLWSTNPGINWLDLSLRRCSSAGGNSGAVSLLFLHLCGAELPCFDCCWPWLGTWVPCCTVFLFFSGWCWGCSLDTDFGSSISVNLLSVQTWAWAAKLVFWDKTFIRWAIFPRRQSTCGELLITHLNFTLSCAIC
jgi:hypothetical protein